jgi:DNA-binding response OmpR family regulator
MNRNARVFIIDPNVKVKEEYRALLSSEGYEIDSGTGLKDSIEKIKNIRYDCIILDVDLPEIKGYEAVQILKAINPKVQLIMTAANNTKELEAKVREKDIFYYYIKTFDREELKSAVKNVFKKSGRAMEVKNMKHSAKILIIDDDPDYVNTTRMILKKKKYQVETAHTKTEGLQKIKQFKPDLIILDIMMERLDDGFTICYKLKHDPELKSIRVLTISAITEKTGFKFNPKTDGEYFEADDYAEKPIEPNDLLQRVEKLLNT